MGILNISIFRLKTIINFERNFFHRFAAKIINYGNHRAIRSHNFAPVLKQKLKFADNIVIEDIILIVSQFIRL